MQIKLRRKSLAGPSDRSSAVTRLITHIFQGTDPVRRHHYRPREVPRTMPAILDAHRFRPLQILARDPAGNQYT